VKLGIVASMVLAGAFGAAAQVVPNSGSLTPPSSRVGVAASPITSENAMEIANPEEVASYKGFVSMRNDDVPKKISAGENYLKRYNSSVLRQQAYAQLTVLYLLAAQPDKALIVGAKAVDLNPRDIRTMGVLCQGVTRMVQPGSAGAASRLEQADKYGRDALGTAPQLLKPAQQTEQDFKAYKDEALAMAYSGLGLLALRHGKFDEAIADLEEAIRLDVTRDPTNAYLLDVANQNSAHFAEAAAAFTKCAEAPGNLKATCTTAAAQANKRAQVASGQ
jgi:tetratricopeptide (TPR) repeat protein